MSKTCIITGASRGIGAATVRKLSEKQYNISRMILVARESDEFRKFVTECEKNAGEIQFDILTKDLSKSHEVREIIDFVHEHDLNVDYLINNAGYTNPKSIPEVDLDDFRMTLEVNLISPFLLVQGLLRIGTEFDTIVNVASTAGMNGRAGWLTYSASKSAMINMSEVMRHELRVYGARVVCLSPGRCSTDLRKRLAPDEDPVTIMQPEHVADIIGVMLSNVGQYIDSQNIVVRQ